MERTREESTVEAILFAMGASVEARQLAIALDMEIEAAREIARGLRKKYATSTSGIEIIELEDSFQMCTKREFYDALIKVTKTPKKPVLTEAILETLSIIAYKQPITKTEIEAIRGVSSDYSVNKLVEYGLVYEAGRLDAPGRPSQFATTEEFLRRFGVHSTSSLPDIAPDEEAKIVEEVESEIGIVLQETKAEGKEHAD